MMTEARPRLTYLEISAYYALLFLAWTFREVFLRQPLPDGAGAFSGALIGAGIKLLVWTVPALLLVRRYQQDMLVPTLFERPVHWQSLSLWVAAIIAYSLIVARLTFGALRIHPAFTPVSLIGTVLFVGITEEAVFRGFLLNTFLTRMRPRFALVLSAALFVLIHFPIWLMKGMFSAPVDLLRSCLTIFVLGCIFGIAFIRDENLIAPIVLHMTWNLATLLLFG